MRRILRRFLHNRRMTAVVILGASGYSGQETLDRVLAHPELEIVALGPTPRRQAGRHARPASPTARAAAFRDERRRARDAGRPRLLLPRPRARGGTRAASRHGRRRPHGRAPSGSAEDYAAWYGFEHPNPGQLDDWRYALPELRAADGHADREPRLLRDRGPARARADRGRDRPSQRRRRRQVGGIWRGQGAEGNVARERRAREHRALPGRRAPARAGDRAGSRVRRVLRAAPAARAARPARHLLRRSRGARPPRPPRRSVCNEPRREPASRRRDPGPRTRAGHGRSGARGVHARRDRPHDRHLRARQPRQGRSGPAMQNANLALGHDDTAGLRLAGVLV